MGRRRRRRRSCSTWPVPRPQRRCSSWAALTSSCIAAAVPTGAEAARSIRALQVEYSRGDGESSRQLVDPPPPHALRWGEQQAAVKRADARAAGAGGRGDL
nr:unnamed protein product [Digitaria exilis]CAB3495778.1 unnamed protein product [Digitaria exilis]